MVEACLRREIEDAIRATGRRPGLLQRRALGGETQLREAQEDETQDGTRIFLGLQSGVGAELVGSVPQMLL